MELNIPCPYSHNPHRFADFGLWISTESVALLGENLSLAVNPAWPKKKYSQCFSFLFAGIEFL